MKRERFVWAIVMASGCAQPVTASAPMCSTTYSAATSVSIAVAGQPCVAPQMAANGRTLQCMGVADVTDTTGVFVELADQSTMTCASGVAVQAVNARQSSGDPVVMFTACVPQCSTDADCGSYTHCVSSACVVRRCTGSH